MNDVRRIPYANGFVIRVLYDDGPDEVMVRYDNGVVFYDYEDFRSRWTDKYGGVFVLTNPEDNEWITELLRMMNLMKPSKQ